MCVPRVREFNIPGRSNLYKQFVTASTSTLHFIPVYIALVLMTWR